VQKRLEKHLIDLRRHQCFFTEAVASEGQPGSEIDEAFFSPVASINTGEHEAHKNRIARMDDLWLDISSYFHSMGP